MKGLSKANHPCLRHWSPEDPLARQTSSSEAREGSTHFSTSASKLTQQHNELTLTGHCTDLHKERVPVLSQNVWSEGIQWKLIFNMIILTSKITTQLNEYRHICSTSQQLLWLSFLMDMVNSHLPQGCRDQDTSLNPHNCICSHASSKGLNTAPQKAKSIPSENTKLQWEPPVLALQLPPGNRRKHYICSHMWLLQNMSVKLLTYTRSLVKCDILITYSEAIVWFIWRYCIYLET